MLLKLNILKSKKDCEEFLLTLMKSSFQNQCWKKFNIGKLSLPQIGTIHAAFTENAENPFDFVMWKNKERTHTSSLIEAINLIWKDRKLINLVINNYN
ncbi:hypothetical protein LCGC14_1118240 [marine sediment metagenome]|uniref:Uncharacterized protein n=1 Tax=marine sediment metagenome TaxID=412755 RepID=A0A0F9M9J5_9ZZZZ